MKKVKIVKLMKIKYNIDQNHRLGNSELEKKKKKKKKKPPCKKLINYS